jgi:hypothetical protein
MVVEGDNLVLGKAKRRRQDNGTPALKVSNQVRIPTGTQITGGCP